MSKYFIIYSHGFGVEKDNRGLFTDIAEVFPDVEHVMFDYNHVDKKNNTLTVSPLGSQAKTLNEKIASIKEDNPDARIDLVCHSQGCVVASLAHPLGIRKTLFLAPPTRFVDVKQKIRRMSERPGTIVIDETVSYPRRDGTTTIIKSDYWDSRSDVVPIKLFNEFAEDTALTCINAGRDEVLSEVDISGLSPAITILSLDADHDFTGNVRNDLITKITSLLD